MTAYELAELVVGKTIEAADFGGKYGSITFTDGTRLELEAEESGRDGYEGESISYVLKPAGG